jgi:hypothetical protein
MNHFNSLQTLMRELDQVEDGLQVLRDRVEVKTKSSINEAIRGAQALRDRLWQVDKALEQETRG